MLDTIGLPMLDTIGIPVLRWLDEVLIPEAQDVLEDFEIYVKSWRSILERGELA